MFAFLFATCSIFHTVFLLFFSLYLYYYSIRYFFFLLCTCLVHFLFIRIDSICLAMHSCLYFITKNRAICNGVPLTSTRFDRLHTYISSISILNENFDICTRERKREGSSTSDGETEAKQMHGNCTHFGVVFILEIIY